MARARKPLPTLQWLQPRLAVSRAIALGSFIALAALLLVWNLAFAVLPQALRWAIPAFQLLPLLLLAPGVLQGSPRAHAWLCFVVNLYFIQGVLSAFDPSRTVFGVLEIMLSLMLFGAAMLYARWSFQYQRRLNGET